ncbi:MAG TPA: response regulator [Arenicellales bacterium]|nr:response regulator [Arenicellales bacterium]
MKRLRVMVVDKNRGRTALLEQALRDQGSEVMACVRGDEDLLQSIERHQPDIILIDMDFPGPRHAGVDAAHHAGPATAGGDVCRAQ